MALSNQTAYDVRAGGNDTNGGAFVVGAAGTDWSQQNAPQYSVTDGVTAGTTTITSATANFGTDVVGNILYVAGGTGAVAANRYQIISRTNATTIVVDRSTGLTTGTGVTLNIGGAMATIQSAMNAAWITSGSAVADCVVWVKKGSYSGATLTTSGAVGPSNYQCRLMGYNTTHGDNPTAQSGNCPTYATTGAGVGGYNNALNGYSIENFVFDGTGTTGTGAVGVTNGGAICHTINVKAMNYSGIGISCNLGSHLEAYNNAGVGISGYVSYSYSHKNGGGGFSCANLTNIAAVNCIAANNTGAGFSLGYQVGIISCISFGNTGDGVSWSSLQSCFAINCIVAANGGWGMNGGGGLAPNGRGFWCDYNVYHNNVSGTITGGVSAGAHDVVISGGSANTPFSASEATNKTEPPVSNDYTLNNNNPGGANARGIFGVQPGILNATSYRDAGPFQHQDSGATVAISDGGGMFLVPMIDPVITSWN